MKPYKIRLSGSTINDDRVALEAHLRKSFGIPPEQPIVFEEDTIKPVSKFELDLLYQAEKEADILRASDLDEDDEDDEDESEES